MSSGNEKSTPKVSRDVFTAALNTIFISSIIPSFVCEAHVKVCTMLTPIICPFLGYIIYYWYCRLCIPDDLSATIIRLKKDKKETRKQLKDKHITPECREQLSRNYDETCLKLSSAHTNFSESHSSSSQDS